MLDSQIKNQCQQYFELIENPVEIVASIGDDEHSKQLDEFLNEIVSLSSKLSLSKAKLGRTPSFGLHRLNEESRIFFAGIPNGHEFTSLILAILQVGGRTIKEDPNVLEAAKAMTGSFHFETYVSLTCQVCPTVVQALNILAVVNPNVTHTMIDGGVYQQEVQEKEILNVPSVYLNGEHFHSGAISIEQLIEKLTGQASQLSIDTSKPFDVLVVGGGPSGSTAAIYAARKGIRTGLIVEKFGGQVNDTVGIENITSIPYIEGEQLAGKLEQHVGQYPVEIVKGRLVTKVEKKESDIEVTLSSQDVLKTKTLIIATGAKWRNVNIPGEQEFLKKGVAYCPHCDGPLFKGKPVAVIGGGNSGVEAAIDLAGTSSHVTLFEFMPELKADAVLQEKLRSLPNVTIYTNTATKEITGDTKVNGITFEDRQTGQQQHIDIDGVFVQIGLAANTAFLDGVVERNRIGEILVDDHQMTNVEGIFAAGDCTNSHYKQIIISMGSGASAALSAFDYLIRKGN